LNPYGVKQVSNFPHVELFTQDETLEGIGLGYKSMSDTDIGI
jgi:hypothetical protein